MLSLETTFKTKSSEYTLAPATRTAPGFCFPGKPIPSNSVIEAIGEENVLKIDKILKNVSKASLMIRGTNCLHPTQYFISDINNTYNYSEFDCHKISDSTISHLFKHNKVIICREIEAYEAFGVEPDDEFVELYRNGFLNDIFWDWNKYSKDDLFSDNAYVLFTPSNFRSLSDVPLELQRFKKEYDDILLDNRTKFKDIFYSL